jgi:hypothetical protein
VIAVAQQAAAFFGAVLRATLVAACSLLALSVARAAFAE